MSVRIWLIEVAPSTTISKRHHDKRIRALRASLTIHSRPEKVKDCSLTDTACAANLTRGVGETDGNGPFFPQTLQKWVFL
jgi:hypothetical protein